LEQAPEEPGARREHVLARLAGDPALAQHAPLLNAVLALDIPQNDLTAHMTGQVRADNTHALLVRLLQDLARTRPLLIVLEDAHWLDSASWTLARLVAREVQPLWLVVVTRPVVAAETRGMTAEAHWFFEAPDVTRVVLDALSPAEAVELACRRLGVSAMPAPAAALVRNKAQGNPFFSEELAYALRESGVLLVEPPEAAGQPGRCRLAPGAGDLGALDFPDTVQGVIVSRIDRLTAPQQLTLKVASVIGRVFPYVALPTCTRAGRSQCTWARSGNLQRLDITLIETPARSAYIFALSPRRSRTTDVLRSAVSQTARWPKRSACMPAISRRTWRCSHHWMRAAYLSRIDHRARGQRRRTTAPITKRNCSRDALRLGREGPMKARPGMATPPARRAH
jgi:hypothetical protein